MLPIILPGVVVVTCPNEPVDVAEPLMSPLNSKPLLKLPDIFDAICAELVNNPVDLGKVVFIPEPSPKKNSPSNRPKEPVDVAEPDIEDENLAEYLEYNL